MASRTINRHLPAMFVILVLSLVVAPVHGAQQDEQTDSVDRVIFGHDLEIGPGVTVNDAVVFGGDLTVRGTVTNDAVVFGGNVEVEQGGSIGGDAVVFGGLVETADGAVLKGSRVELDFGRRLFKWLRLNRFGGGKFPASGVVKRLDRCRPPRFLFPLMFFISTLAIGALFAAFLPKRSACVQATVTGRMGMALFAGFSGIVLLPVVIVLLGVSLVGIPLIPVCLLLLGFAIFWGFINLGAFIGGRLTGNSRTISIKTMAVGLLVFSALLFVPVAGKLLNMLFALVGFGAVILSGFGSRPVPSSSPPAVPKKRTRSAVPTEKKKSSPSRRRGRDRDSRGKRSSNRRPRKSKDKEKDTSEKKAR